MVGAIEPLSGLKNGKVLSYWGIAELSPISGARFSYHGLPFWSHLTPFGWSPHDEVSFVSKSWKRVPLRPDQLGSELGRPSKIDLWLNQGVVHGCTISTSSKITFFIFMARLLFWENVSSLWQANISGDFPNEMTKFPPLYFREPCDFAPNQPQTRNQNTC